MITSLALFSFDNYNINVNDEGQSFGLDFAREELRRLASFFFFFTLLTWRGSN